ncbi:hypothetical protein K474DRAFT_1679581 [Panus rudis PR-1116 ss-1]|nr:hypothetical protein K474DRAFT_1679581 [Panus rudis PR-1116 ss-1]
MRVAEVIQHATVILRMKPQAYQSATCRLPSLGEMDASGIRDSTAVETIPGFTVEGLLGGTLIFFCFVFMVYGVTTCQAYVYMLNCEKDPWWFKFMVLWLWMLETLHTAFCIRMLYFLFIVGYGDLSYALRIDWSFINFIIATVEGFFLRRIWILSKGSYILVFGTAALLIARMTLHLTALGLGYVTHTTILPLLGLIEQLRYSADKGTWENFRSDPGPNITAQISNPLGAVVDGIIALSMIYYLQQGQSEVDRTSNIVKWIMAYTINSGAIMMVLAVTVTVVYVKVQDSVIFLGIIALIGKVYANCLLGTLNARGMLRNMPSSRDRYTSRSGQGVPIELSNIHVTSMSSQARHREPVAESPN